MAGKRNRSPKPARESARLAEDDLETSADDGNTKRPLDISTVEGIIPIERLKDGWTLPEYDPDNPEHERAARQIADLLWRVQKRHAAERRAKAEAESIAAEPKFVRVRRRR